MEKNGATTASTVDLNSLARSETLPTALNSTKGSASDASLLAQLTDNPFFTAVSLHCFDLSCLEY